MERIEELLRYIELPCLVPDAANQFTLQKSRSIKERITTTLVYGSSPRNKKLLVELQSSAMLNKFIVILMRKNHGQEVMMVDKLVNQEVFQEVMVLFQRNEKFFFEEFCC